MMNQEQHGEVGLKIEFAGKQSFVTESRNLAWRFWQVCERFTTDNRLMAGNPTRNSDSGHGLSTRCAPATAGWNGSGTPPS
jgi:hypothetical protein